MRLHWTAEAIMYELHRRNDTPGEPVAVTVPVTTGSTAWNPATTKDVLHGPLEVTYILHPDGGVVAVQGFLPTGKNKP